MSDGCLIEGCGRRQRARQMCEMHYGQAKRAGLGELRRKMPERASGRKLDAQQGINSNCVDCWEKPYAGGMRCLPCFQARCDARAGTHSVVQRPGTAGYAAGCRCRGCREAAALRQRELRAERAA